MKNILVLGSSGFLGKKLIVSEPFKKANFLAPSSSEFDLSKTSSFFEADKLRIDEIWHLAAKTQAGTYCDTERGNQWIINQKINTNALDYWLHCQPQAKFITFGTSVSYSSEDDLTEYSYLCGLPNDKFKAYAMCKRMLLIGLQCLNYQFGMEYLYLVPSTLYGPDYHTDGRQLHFIYDLIRKIWNGKKRGIPVVLWGDGSQSRELVFVEDFVNISLSLNEKVSNEIINVGAGHEISIREFARQICHIVGYECDSIQYDTSKYVGAKSKCLNVEKLNQILPDRKMTNLGTGLGDVIDWVEKHLDKLNDIAGS